MFKSQNLAESPSLIDILKQKMEEESDADPNENPADSDSDESEWESGCDSTDETLLADHQKRLDTRCLIWIICAKLPFTIVDHPSFRVMIKAFQPRYKIPTGKDIAAGVWDMFRKEKANIKKMIDNTRVSITIDTWTSTRDFNYMVVAIHFLDDEWKLHKKIINFIMTTSDEEDDIRRVLDRCLSNWGIKKVFSVAVNDVSVGADVVDYMKEKLNTPVAFVLDGIHLHMKCACNIINMIIEDVMKEMFLSIEGIRNCVRFIHSHSDRLEMFRNFASQVNMDKMAIIPLDNVTRWDSTYHMLSSAINYKDVFVRMAKENDEFNEYFEEWMVEAKMEGPPVEEDWEKVKSFAHILKICHNATTKLSAKDTPTSNLILETMVALQVEIENTLKRCENLSVESMVHSIKSKFDKYWGSIDDVKLVIFLAQVLDPRYKLDMIDVYMESSDVKAKKIDQMKESIKEHLTDLVKAYKVEIEEERLRVLVQVDSLSMVQEEDVEEIFRSRLMKKRKHMEISNEVEKYLKDPFENPYDNGFNLLKWWKENSSRYPILSKIARDVLALPSSTVGIEDAFSLGKRVLDPFRSSLPPKTLEALMCIHDWVSDEEDYQPDEDTGEKVEVYKELEEIDNGKSM